MAYTTIDDPTSFFNTILYTGDGNTSRGITGVGFQPDWLWIKRRDATEGHVLFDVVRSADARLQSNNNSVEADRPNIVYSFDSDGFSVSQSGIDNASNNNGGTYVAWNWKAGTSFSNDTSSTGVGSIDSSGSINTTAGFSIIGFTGNAQTGTTIAHGLGVKPDWIILKNRGPDIANWQVYHSSLTATHYIQLNSDGAATDSNTRWNDTEPTSTVFTTGSSGDVKGDSSGETFIAYCFTSKKGFSKFGSYTGNGNADGPFVYTGFKPAFLIVKISSGTNEWTMRDNKRDVDNSTNHTLYPNLNSAEAGGSGEGIDFLSNGFKLRLSAGSLNGNNSTYIYMAFAESPFVNSNGIPNNAR